MENNHNYSFNILKAGLRLGKTSFLAKQIDFEMNLNASLLGLSSKTEKLVDSLVDAQDSYKGFPNFFRPAVKVPGYTYYYRADSTSNMMIDQNGDTTYKQMSEDSVVATGNAIIEADLSWRFPLSGKKSIDKKLGFIYLDKIYGAVNAGGVLTSTTVSGLTDKSYEDVLYYGGLELRMKAIAFNNYPLALSFRWDRGFSRDAPVGGDRLTLAIGFDFDNWSIIESPDGARFSPAIMDGYR